MFPGGTSILSRQIFTSALCAAMLLAAPWQVRAATYYVSKTGCSDTGAGSSATPWCSPSVGAAALKPGDVLKIRSGTYKAQLVIKASGTIGNRIVIEAAKGATVIMDGSSLSFNEQGMIHAEKRSDLTIRGLTVKASPFYCMQISNSARVTVEEMSIDGCKHGGIVFDQGSTAVKALNNKVTKTDRCGKSCGIHEAITLSQVTGFEVANNDVHHGLKEGIDAKDRSTQGSIHHNTVRHMGQVGIYLNHAQGVKVYQNKVHDSGSTCVGIAVGDYAAGLPATTNNDIYQNDIWNCRWHGLEFFGTEVGAMDRNRIFNNVFYANGGSGISIGAATSTVIVNNILALNKEAGIDGDGAWANAISHNLFHKNAGSAVGVTYVEGDPMFTDPAKGDFSLKAGSAAIDRGYDMGLARTGRPDIGAHEFTGATGGGTDEGGCAVSRSGAAGAPAAGLCPLLLLVLLRARRRPAPWRRHQGSRRPGPWRSR